MLETQNFHKVLAVVLTKLCTRRYMYFFQSVLFVKHYTTSPLHMHYIAQQKLPTFQNFPIQISLEGN